MPKLFKSLLLALLTTLSLGALAQEAAIRKNIAARLPQLKAIDEVRKAEASQVQRDGYELILTKARWCLLKRLENLIGNQEVKLKELLQYNPKSIRAHLLRGLFQKFWDYATPA